MFTLSAKHQSIDAPTRKNLRSRARWALIFFLAVGLLILNEAAAAEGAATATAEKSAKGYRLIQTTCDAVGSETASKGQFVCQYVCRDTAHTKLAVVYSNSGAGQCRSPISSQIKQAIKEP